jgi:hypothetical protein
MADLKIKHPIPVEALDEDIAILGRKGGGKSYTAKGIVERLLDMGRRVLVLDPLGVWAGLRTSADGEHAGYPVAIFGGLHGDLPLDVAAAEPLARIIATENLPAVIDLSELSKSAQQAFLLKFLHELRRANHEALTVVLEEADVFAPQNPQGDDSKALHGEIDWIARRGRFKGFRLLTITQRPARLSKDVLTQANMVIMHRLPAPQDRDAAKAWVDGNGDRDQAKIVFDTLAGLKVGEAWVLAQEPPMLERAVFPRINTLDTSATPRAGETRIEPKTLAQVDVSAIRSALQVVQVDARPAGGPGAAKMSASDLATAEEHGYQRGRAEGERHGISIGFHAALARAKAALDGIDATDLAASSPISAPPPMAAKPAASGPKRTSSAPPSGKSSTDPLLTAALSVWPARLTWPALASMCGRKARGGHFNTARKALIDSGLIRMDGELVTPSSPPTAPEGAIPADLLEQNLPQPAAKMFATIRAKPGITITGLASVLGMQPRGGHWNTGMSTLRRNGLIEERGEALNISPSLLPGERK